MHEKTSESSPWSPAKIYFHHALLGERAATAVLLLHYFLVSAAVIAGKSARDVLFRSHSEKSVFPLMSLANAVVITAAMALL